jgi:hypothetical protein
MINIKDIIWLAGLLEGEGCFSLSTKRQAPTIGLKMTDEDIVTRARGILSPLSKITISLHPSKKTSYHFSIYGNLAAAWMMTLYSLMGRRRKERIRELLQIWRSTKGINSNRKLKERKYQATLAELIRRSNEVSRVTE